MRACFDCHSDRTVEDDLWPIVARLRCFRGIDTLSALVLHLEVHDWQRFRRAPRLASSNESGRS